jgi:Dolichyl-phosphate-mannose-protein mannosyltransferase
MAETWGRTVKSPRPHSALIFAVFFLALLATHAPLLRLPYFWDEAGYYVPAARDLMLTGSLIPHTTPSNAHPPLVMAYLAVCWKIFGYAPLVTRTAMLLVAAFALLGLFRLARRAANTDVAIAVVICTAVYPVFFVQSSLAQVDLVAAGLTFWALLAYIEDRHGAMAFWFSLAVLAKETAILAPLALFAWQLLRWALRGQDWMKPVVGVSHRVWLLAPVVPLGLWYAYHRWRTGFLLGNPEFFRYNVQATMHPLRIALTFLMRLWQIFGYMGLYVLTLAAAAAMWLPPLREAGNSNEDRPRIPLDVQFAFLAVISAYVLALSVIGGAVLARYMLPAVPLVILVGISTLRRRVRWWRGVVAIVALALVTSLVVNPPYGFSLEDNLAYRNYIVLHQDAFRFLQAHYPTARVLTAWPASGELSQPWLGYVTRPMRVLQIENFTAEELMSAAERPSDFDVALVFSTKYEPPHPLLQHWVAWEKIKAEFFGYYREVSPPVAAQILGGKLVYTEYRTGQWVGLIEMEPIEEALHEPSR